MIKKITERIRSWLTVYDVRRKIILELRGGTVTFAPVGRARGRALISYTTLPFVNRSEDLDNGHTNIWESRDMVNAFLERGYAVDVIDRDNRSFIPRKKYRFFIDTHSNIERLAAALGPGCVKVFHATAQHWLSQNRAEYSRLIDIRDRRGVVLRPRRLEMPTNSPECADIITIMGNETTQSTYRFANKKMFQIPISTTQVFPSPQDKNFDDAKRRFLWIGGSGMVLKGLDLVLEAFARMPECELFICGKVEKEKDFVHAFRKELFETPNIHVLGDIDTSGACFDGLRSKCAALVFPSAAEGQAGSVIVSMHAGLIPIVSQYAGVDVEGCGIILKDLSINGIMRSARDVASRRPEELRAMAVSAWDYARKNHTRERFASEYRRFIDEILMKWGSDPK